MKTNILVLFFLVSIVLVSCNNTRKEMSEQEGLRSELLEKERDLHARTDVDPEAARAMIGKYIEFVNKYPEDSLSSKYLFKAAEIAMNFEQPNNSITYLTRIEDNYPDYEEYGTSLFLKAFIYDNYLKSYEKAEQYYNIFLEKYPDHPFAKDAKSSLMFLGISDDDLIKLFEDTDQ